jgi:DNA-binding transcriptional MerR regulator
MEVFTKKETADLTGLSVRQLDYWAKDQLGVIPQKIGVTVVYTTDQVIELFIGSHLKSQNFSLNFIAGFLQLLRLTLLDIPLQPIYSMSLETYLTCAEIREKLGDEFPDDISNRIVTDDNGQVRYVFLTEDEVVKFMKKILGFKKLKLEEIEIPTFPNMIEELRKKARKVGISPERIREIA